MEWGNKNLVREVFVDGGGNKFLASGEYPPTHPVGKTQRAGSQSK